MEKVINVDIKEMDDLVERYNEEIVSKDLTKYILNQAKYVNKKEKVKVAIDIKFETNVDVVHLIKKSLKNEYDLNLKKSYITNIRQLFFLFFGMAFLFLSTIINNEIISEVILIGGWILIWEMLDLQLFTDTELQRDKMILKKLLKSDFVVNKKVIKE